MLFISVVIVKQFGRNAEILWSFSQISEILVKFFQGSKKK